MDTVIFQASDLVKERVRVLDAARAGRAVLRDRDGVGLVMLPEARLNVLEGFAKWSQTLQRLDNLLRSKREASVIELGDLAWLRVFDRADRLTFSRELHLALIAGLADDDLGPVEEVVRDWKITARQLEDPLRRSILLGSRDIADFVEVDAPRQ